MVALLLTRANPSLPLWKLPVMATVALASVGESASDRVRALSTTTGVDRTLLPSVKVTAPGLGASGGAGLRVPQRPRPTPPRLYQRAGGPVGGGPAGGV